jgi:YYY domain-containing protein
MKNEKYSWIYDLIFILVLLMAGYLRIAGYNWGEGHHQHPDELFLSGVLDNLRAQTCEDPNIPIDGCPLEQKRWMTIGEYFDSSTSTLNPYVRGHAFFVYGNLPMTISRVLLEAFQDEITNSKFFARQLSAIADLFTVFILYLLVSKLYGQKIGLFAATFSSLAVLQIQQSHFFTADTFLLMFMTLTLWFGVSIVESRKHALSSIEGSKVEEGKKKDEREESYEKREISNEEKVTSTDNSSNLQSPVSNYQLPITNYASRITHFARNPLFLLTLGFGFALGMAMASKINAAVLCFVLPFAFFVRYLVYDRDKKLTTEYWSLITAFLIIGGLATIISFRIFQPYAFDGIGLNPQWVANLKELQAQASGTADLAWNLQWARRSNLFSFQNLTVWGLGLPLGILAWAGFLMMAWRIFKHKEYQHLLLWGWTAFYFTWQSLQFNATMRYQLPIYPLLCMMAAWVIFESRITHYASRTTYSVMRNVFGIVGIAVLILTTIWAFAFHSIYLRDETRIAASRWIFENVPAGINLNIQTENDTYNQPLPISPQLFIASGNPYLLNFTPRQEGILREINFGYALDVSGLPTEIDITVYSASQPDVGLAHASATLDSSSINNLRGVPLTLTLDRVIPLVADGQYIIKIETSGSGLSISGSAIANETDYDYGLPFRVDGYDPYGGLYSNEDLILQVYWADDANKINRFVDILSKSDYIVIPTNHQYGQITRLPERYPLTTLYYRELLGCPADQEIIECYRVAQPETYQGNLGFDLVAVFESYPTFGDIVINDQAAEEAFTFYDHPKVMIFKKSETFDANQVRAILNTVDLTKVVQLKPAEFDDFKTLMLPESQLVKQRAGGTWSELFSYDWIQNKYPWLGVLYWYVFIFLLGLFAYPIARLALPGLKQYSYALGRIVGILLLAWLAWMAGSIGLDYTRLSIGVAFVAIAVTGITLALKRKDEIVTDWKSNRKFFIMAEVIFFTFFVIDLLIRLGNPDLWHPAKGGERPMDFSYFNAVLKSTSFPAYDPWFAGGYINYYYYGFVLAGTPVKLLGIVPSIAYNFLLPTWFALVALGAFAIGFSLVTSLQSQVSDERPATLRQAQGNAFDLRLISGIAASFLSVFLGNLGTIQFIFNSIQRIPLQGAGVPADTPMFERWSLTFQGLWKMITEQAQMPIGRGDWYWNPSRVIPPGPGNEITEFPLFTFLYSDLHAHMLVMPIALFIIAWSVSFVLSRADLTLGEWIGSFFIGALAIGALKPTNTWDLYTYYLLAAIAMGYAIYRNVPLSILGRGVRGEGQKIIITFGAVILLYVLSSLLYYPFTYWWGQGYNSVQYWSATRTPFGSYFTQWGLFLFIITAWLAWETREWMASTPVSKLSGLKKYVLVIELILAGFIALLVFFAFDGVYSGLISLPLALWSGILILRADLPDTKRFVLFLIGTALTITLAVEFISLVGDIGRMNTIFKLYLQAWMMFAVSAAAAFGWLLNVFFTWKAKWRNTYQGGVYILLAGAFLFTLTGTTDKISDRMNPDAPHSLDSMEFMNHSQLWDGQTMDLSQDYRAIRWMQDNVIGSPVIVEANCTEYRWCTRFTIYTGLPGVVGWNWHQRQQRGIFSIQVQDRVNEVGTFYNTTDIQSAVNFLKKYDVQYIIVGQLERNVYPVLPDLPDGLAKFKEYEGVYWQAVYEDLNTTIYEVIK